MILEEATFKEFNYYSTDLPPQSNKRILAACDECGKMRKVFKSRYRALCGSCAQKGKIVSEKHKANISTAMKGDKNPNYKGGKKVAQARINAKRRNLGHNVLTPVKEGEHEHHVTNADIIGIPTEVHQRFSGHKRKKHRTLVLKWLKTHNKKKYKLVLCVLAKEPLEKLS